MAALDTYYVDRTHTNTHTYHIEKHIAITRALNVFYNSSNHQQQASEKDVKILKVFSGAREGPPLVCRYDIKRTEGKEMAMMRKLKKKGQSSNTFKKSRRVWMTAVAAVHVKINTSKLSSLYIYLGDSRWPLYYIYCPVCLYSWDVSYFFPFLYVTSYSRR
jgi:hypothetical protein